MAWQKHIGDNTAIDTIDGRNYHITQIEKDGSFDEILIGIETLENLYIEIGQELLRRKAMLINKKQ